MRKSVSYNVFSQAEQIAQEAVKQSLMGLIWRKAEEWVGSAYTDQQARCLTQMSRFYQQAGLGEERPPMFVLNQEKRPEYVLNPESWASFVFSIASQQSAQPLSRFGNHLALQCAGYLDSCQERWVKDKQGNPLQQFFSEFMFFGLAVLSTMNPSEAIQSIEERLNYLDLMADESTLFEESWKAWRMNKRDVLQRLRRVLKSAKAYAIEESTKSCVRDEIRRIRDSFHGLLETIGQILYSARANKEIQNIPMVDIVRFCNGILSNDVPTDFDQLDSKIRETATGRLLWELIYLSGPLAFGHPTQYKITKPEPLIFFNEALQPKPIQWSYFSEKLDLPEWVGSVLEKQQYVEQMRDHIQVALRLARLLDLLEKAYELSGHLGNQWAYGNPIGVASLDLLLKLLAFDVTTLQQQLSQQVDKDELRREVYNRVHHKKQHGGSNLNFIRVKKHAQHFNRLVEFSLKSIQNIKTQRDAFPADQGDIVALRQRFYTELGAFAQKYYAGFPEALEQQKQLKKLIREEEKKKLLSVQEGVVKVNYFPEKSALDGKNRRENGKTKEQWQQCFQSYRKENRALFNEIKIKKRFYHLSWTLTAQIGDLLRGDDFLHYQRMMQEIDRLLKAARGDENLRFLLDWYRQASEKNLQLQTQVRKLQAKISWSFGFLPFRCRFGWPFNYNNQSVLNKLDQQLRLSQQALQTLLKADLCLSEHRYYYMGRIDERLEQQLFQGDSMPEWLRGSVREQSTDSYSPPSPSKPPALNAVGTVSSPALPAVTIDYVLRFKKAIRDKAFQKARVLLDEVNQRETLFSSKESRQLCDIRNILNEMSQYLHYYLLVNLFPLEKPNRLDEYASTREINELIITFKGGSYSPRWSKSLSLLMRRPGQMRELLIVIQRYFGLEDRPICADSDDFKKLILNAAHRYLPRVFKLLTAEQQDKVVKFFLEKRDKRNSAYSVTQQKAVEFRFFQKDPLPSFRRRTNTFSPYLGARPR